jgi:hypothetical protein
MSKKTLFGVLLRVFIHKTKKVLERKILVILEKS